MSDLDYDGAPPLAIRSRDGREPLVLHADGRVSGDVYPGTHQCQENS